MNKSQTFQQSQLELTNVIRTGKGQITNIEVRRIAIYQELFFNNVEGFCSSAFPITKTVLGEDKWVGLVRQFFIECHCETPHFIEISQEFLTYLINKQDEFPSLPFLSELAHYEWIELDLDVKPIQNITNSDSQLANHNKGLHLLEACYPLLYNYPVHMISAENIDSIEPELTPVVVYRNANFEIKFTLVDQLSVIMLQLIQQNPSISKEVLATELMGLNETFTYESMLTFLNNALPTFIKLELVYSQ
jgi:hypothetical protein